ncbi:MAG TPA: hypothetical protein VFD31_02530, partial [Thermoleophilaceae bacterium]|nr:hypothetical protein [Thermoleophilaceae bacterium]
EPVVEAADADDEAERHCEQRDRGDRAPVEQRVVAVGRPDRDYEQQLSPAEIDTLVEYLLTVSNGKEAQ